MQLALKKQSGHGSDVDEKNYAGEKFSTGNLASDEMYYTRTCRDWHTMLGFKTHAERWSVSYLFSSTWFLCYWHNIPQLICSYSRAPPTHLMRLTVVTTTSNNYNMTLWRPWSQFGHIIRGRRSYWGRPSRRPFQRIPETPLVPFRNSQTSYDTNSFELH